MLMFEALPLFFETRYCFGADGCGPFIWGLKRDIAFAIGRDLKFNIRSAL